MSDPCLTLVVMSRKRPDNIAVMDTMFPDAYWVVAESETKDYRAVEGRLISHPDDVVGIGAIRQWILDNMPGDVFMLDDDIEYLWSNVGKLGRRVIGPWNIRQAIENAAEVARAVGAPVFGFAQAWDVRKYNPFDPMAFTGWVGTALGFIGRDVKYDTSLKSQADIDFCMRVLLKQRKIYIDKRFSFACKRFNNKGGSAGVRDFETYKRQVEIVTKRWAGWVRVQDAKTTIRLKVDVPRRQPIEI